ncbi:acyltransferase family protein [Chryseobacterium vrystaatense]|nr:acyltransferase [Chryseobacterium vrystaatense]
MHQSHINSLRGIAILMVVLVHVSSLFTFTTRFETTLFYYGKMGVQLFFIASAYTLCLSAENRREESNPTLNFYIRRYFRIFPIYYFGIVLYYILHLSQGSAGAYTLKNIFLNVLLIHGFVPAANESIVHGGWSIGAEMIFYMIFPFLFKFMKSGRPVLKGLFVIALGQLLLVLISKRMFIPFEYRYTSIFNQISVFVIGIIFYLKKKHFLSFNGALIGFVLFTAASFSLMYFEVEYQHILIPILSGIAFCCLFLIAEKSKIVNNRIFQEIGEKSYSIYIIHFVFTLYILPKMNGYFLLTIAYLSVVVLSYLMSVVLNKWVEKPFIKLGHKVINLLSNKEPKAVS